MCIQAFISLLEEKKGLIYLTNGLWTKIKFSIEGHQINISFDCIINRHDSDLIMLK